MERSTVTFYPKLSIYLFFYLLLAHVFAAICVIATMDGALLFSVLLVLLMSGTFYICHYCGLSSTERVDSLRSDALHEWSLLMVDGSQKVVTLSGNSIVMRYLMVLRFVEVNTGKKHVVLLFPDSLPCEQMKIVRRRARLAVM